jgi:2-dehydropantoate 2-reductase
VITDVKASRKGKITVNIVMVGAGAVGGYFGAKLAKSGIPLTFLVRENRYRQLKESGLNVHSVHGNFSIVPQMVRSAKEVDRPEVVILSMKNYHLENALPEIAELVHRGSKVLPLLNGVDHIDTLVSMFGEEKILGGTCYVESTLNQDGDIVQTSPMQDIVFGPLTNVSESWLQKLEDVFKAAEIRVKRSDSILAEMWQKYIFLVTLSGVTSAVRSPIGAILEDEVSKAFLYDLIDEVVRIANAKSLTLPDHASGQILQKLESCPPTMTSSMYRDLIKGLPLELDSLHGSVISMGKRYRIPTPCNKAVYALLHPYKSGNRNP